MKAQRGNWFLFKHGGKSYLLPKHCPHRGGRLDLGYHNEEKGLVVCPLHKSTFCVPTGERVGGPACGGIKVDEAPESQQGEDTGEAATQIVGA